MLSEEIISQVHDLSTSELLEHCTKIAENLEAILTSGTEEAQNMQELLTIMVTELKDRGFEFNSLQE